MRSLITCLGFSYSIVCSGIPENTRMFLMVCDGTSVMDSFISLFSWVTVVSFVVSDEMESQGALCYLISNVLFFAKYQLFMQLLEFFM